MQWTECSPVTFRPKKFSKRNVRGGRTIRPPWDQLSQWTQWTLGRCVGWTFRGCRNVTRTLRAWTFRQGTNNNRGHPFTPATRPRSVFSGVWCVWSPFLLRSRSILWVYASEAEASGLKGQSSLIWIPFLTDMDRPRLEYKRLLDFTFFRGSNNFLSTVKKKICRKDCSRITFINLLVAFLM
jgi:hypothetical protein